MKLLGPAVDIYQKEIVEKEVLEEVILVKSLPVSNGKTLNLKCGHLAESIYILSCAGYSQDIFKGLIVIDLEILISLDFL